MNENELKNLIKQAVHETLTGLGFDVMEVHETQADMIYVRKLRKGSEQLNEKITAAVIGVSIPTILYMLWQAIKNSIRGE